MIRTEHEKNKRGKPRNVWQITFKGLLEAFKQFKEKDDVESIKIMIENFPNLSITFKKWGLFKEAGLEHRMLLYLMTGINATLRAWALDELLGTQAEEGENYRETIDGNIIYSSLFASHDKNIAKIIKQDSELNQLMKKMLKYHKEQHDRTEAFEKWWKKI